MGLLDALGWVGESLGKPGAAVRGLLAGRPDQLMNLVPFSDTMGLTDPSQRTSGRDLLRQWGAIGEDDNWGNFAGGMALEAVLDPLVLYGAYSSIPKSAAAMRANAASMLAKRRQFGMMTEIPGKTIPWVGQEAPTYKLLGMAPEEKVVADFLAHRSNLGTAGLYSGDFNLGVSPANLPSTYRHELMHGLINQAAKSGDSAGLGPISSLSAKLQGTGGFREGISALANELSAHIASQKTLGGQLKKASDYLIHKPWNAHAVANRQMYANQLGNISPLAKSIYQGIGYSPYVSGTGLSLLGGIDVANYLSDNAN